MKNLLIFFALPLLALDNSVRINDASGSTQASQPRTIHRYFAQGEFPSGTYPKPRAAGSVPATWQVDVESTYPDGSVMAAFVSLPVSIAANSSVVVDFVADSNPCHLGNLATCQAAALDQSGMLAFNSSTWDAVLSGTAGGLTYSANARTMLTAGACSQYQLRGPVVTRVLCEDFTRPNPVYDFGWQWDATANAANAANAIGAFGATGKRVGFRFKWGRIAGGTRGAVTTISLPSHGLTSGQQVRLLKGSYAWEGANGVWTVTVVDANSFTIPVDSTGWGFDAPAGYLTAIPVNMVIGLGSSNSSTPTDGAFVRVAWPQLQLAVRTGGVETTVNFGSADDPLEMGFEISSDPLDPTAKVQVTSSRQGLNKTICPAGCDFTVASGWAATNFLPLNRFDSGTVGVTAIVDRPDSWIAPSTNAYKSIHPWFTLAFYAGWAGVEVELMAAQAATTRFQRQNFDLAVTKTSGAVVYARPAFDMPRNSAFTRYFWDGSAPAAVQIDFNLKYMIHSRILPPFDWSKARTGGTDVTTFTNILGGYDAQDCRPGLWVCGNWAQHIGSSGSRGDIGLIPRWYVTYAFAMGDTSTYTVAQRKELFDKGIIGNADAAQTLPVHYLEYDNSAARDNPADGNRYYFDAANTVPAFGRIASMHARPEWYTGSEEGTLGTDAMPAICTSGACEGHKSTGDLPDSKGWGPEMGHMPGAFAIPYILTGRYSYLVGQLDLATYAGAYDKYPCGGSGWIRCYDWGIQMIWGNHRTAAWALREVGMAAVLAPSARPEKAYFARILEKNDEMWEGVYSVTGGNAGATSSVTYCQGSDKGAGTRTINGSSDMGFNGLSGYKYSGLTRMIPLITPMYSVTGVTVNGGSKTFGIMGVDSGRDFYYSPGGVVMYQDDAATPLITSDVVSVAYRATDVPSPWCIGRQVVMKGQPNNIGHSLWNESRDYGSFMLYYFVWTRKYLEDTGAFTHSVTGQPLFKFTNEATAKYIVGWATDPNANPHNADGYDTYNVGPSNILPANWTEFMDLFPKTSTISSDMTNSATTFYVVDSHASWPYTLHYFYTPILVKVESEWIAVCSWYESSSPNVSQMTACSGGRGKFGTAAVAHSAGATFDWTRQEWNGYGADHSYPNLYASAVAMYEQYILPSGTGRRAWERVTGDLNGQQNRMNAPEYAFVPRDRIGNVRATPGTGSLALAWTAPSGAACVVGLNPTSSDDSGDATATAKGRAQSYNATGLSAGANTYRITCGTARVEGAATIQ